MPAVTPIGNWGDTGLVVKVQHLLRSPQVTSSRGSLCLWFSLQWPMHKLTLNEQLHIKSKVTRSDSPSFKHSRPVEPGVKFDFLMPRHAAAYTATTQREISALKHSPQHYRVSIFRKSETLPVWFWECWYCLCCCCTCCCCACGTCCVCGCCWMYPTVLCCGTLVCKNVDVDPPCTSPWAICGQRRDMNMNALWAADRTPVTRFVSVKSFLQLTI